MIMRKAASCCQPLHEMVVPRGARTVRGPLPSGGFAEEVFSTLGMVYGSFSIEKSKVFLSFEYIAFRMMPGNSDQNSVLIDNLYPLHSPLRHYYYVTSLSHRNYSSLFSS